jgi:hypothetical protein
VRFEVDFKGILPANQSFQFGDRLIFFLIYLFSSVEETHVSLQRKTCVLEAAACSSLFTWET